MEPEPHTVLGVAADAPLEEIRAAYRRLARETHPDRNSSPDAAQRFIAIHSAWLALRDRAAARERTRAKATPRPTVRTHPRRSDPVREPSARRGDARRARLALVHERAALEVGAVPPGCAAVRPSRVSIFASLLLPALPAAVACAMLGGAAPHEGPRQIGGLAFGALALLLLAVRAPALFASATGRLAIWVGPGGVHEVRGRSVRSMGHHEIRALEFGYDPIGRFGFHPFYLELLIGPEARPFRLRRPYGARELRRVIDLVLAQERALG